MKADTGGNTDAIILWSFIADKTLWRVLWNRSERSGFSSPRFCIAHAAENFTGAPEWHNHWNTLSSDRRRGHSDKASNTYYMIIRVRRVFNSSFQDNEILRLLSRHKWSAYIVLQYEGRKTYNTFYIKKTHLCGFPVFRTDPTNRHLHFRLLSLIMLKWSTKPSNYSNLRAFSL